MLVPLQSGEAVLGVVGHPGVEGIGAPGFHDARARHGVSGFAVRNPQEGGTAFADKGARIVIAGREQVRSLQVRQREIATLGHGRFLSGSSAFPPSSYYRFPASNTIIGRYGRLDVYAFDPVSTTLAKVERGASRDIEDALALLRRGVVTVPELQTAFEAILPRLETESLRVDESDFRRKFERFLQLVDEMGLER
jgi:hypothetical protein